MNKEIVDKCKILLEGYKTEALGQTNMPEDTNPGFSDDEQELRIAYFSLPMALNYQRDSYKLWESALKTYRDSEAKVVFEISRVNRLSEEDLRTFLLRYKVALQPQKHIQTWRTIAQTVYTQFGSFQNLFKETDNDYLKLKETIQTKLKKGFPYLSGPKIFNYWSFILSTYGKIDLKNKKCIEIAPDTHVTQCSVRLGVITQEEAVSLSKEEISARWKEALKDSGISPIDMHSPLWFWSRNGFLFKFD